MKNQQEIKAEVVEIAKCLRSAADLLDVEVQKDFAQPENLARIARKEITPCVDELKDYSYMLKTEVPS